MQAPIANRLAVWQLKHNSENLSIMKANKKIGFLTPSTLCADGVFFA